MELVDDGVFVPEIVPLQRQGSTPLRSGSAATNEG
jgi:hypothetical protein